MNVQNKIHKDTSMGGGGGGTYFLKGEYVSECECWKKAR